MSIAASVSHFDDIALLRLMLGLDERGQLAHIWGERLIQEAGGRPGDEAQRRAFVRELHILRDDGLIDFVLGRIGGQPEPHPEDYAYLQHLREFRLRTAGRDRAKGEIVRLPLPDPEHDDGRPIPTRIVERFADALSEQLRDAETRSFLHDAGVPAERLPDFAAGSAESAYARIVILELLRRASSGRRIVREVIGRWLSDQLAVGPTPEQRDDITRALARVGWHLKAATLVVGDRVVVPTTSVPGSLERVIQICRRFNEVARQLGRRHAGRETLTIADEHDAQDLLHALLRIDFDDVRAEPWNPSHLGAGSRPDFLLAEAGILVELKMVREALRDADVGRQLAQDVTLYGGLASSQGVSTLVCSVYDPEQLLVNPRGLEADLGTTSTERLHVVAVIA